MARHEARAPGPTARREKRKAAGKRFVSGCPGTRSWTAECSSCGSGRGPSAAFRASRLASEREIADVANTLKTADITAGNRGDSSADTDTDGRVGCYGSSGASDAVRGHFPAATWWEREGRSC